MSDLSEKTGSASTKIVGADPSTGVENNYATANTLGELAVNDTPNQTPVSTTLSLTTTQQEAKVGGSPMVNRKYVEIQALSNNIKWGYTTACLFDIFKNQFFSIPAGPACPIYVKMSSGTGNLVVAEK